jgi:hypothetical protein
MHMVMVGLVKHLSLESKCDWGPADSTDEMGLLRMATVVPRHEQRQGVAGNVAV